MKKEKGQGLAGLLSVLFIISMIVLVGYSIYRNYTLGNDASDWEQGCLPNGNTVWIASFTTKGYAVLNLDDAGKPVKCVPR